MSCVFKTFVLSLFFQFISSTLCYSEPIDHLKLIAVKVLENAHLNFLLSSEESGIKKGDHISEQDFDALSNRTTEYTVKQIKLGEIKLGDTFGITYAEKVPESDLIQENNAQGVKDNDEADRLLSSIMLGIESDFGYKAFNIRKVGAIYNLNK